MTGQTVTRHPSHLHCEFRADQKPVATLGVGDRIVVETAHAFALIYEEGMSKEEFTAALVDMDDRRANPMTGPIAIEGAQAGDTLVVEIDSLEVTSELGLCPILTDGGFLREQVPGPHVGTVAIENGVLRFAGGIEYPVRPSIGVIGVCPAEPILSLHPGDHGGNLDDPHLTTGATLYLPVFVDGALLSCGDVHGAQGDTEWRAPSEVDSVVGIRVLDLIKGARMESVWTETSSHWIVYGTEAGLGESLEVAAGRMAGFVSTGFDLTLEDTLVLLSNVADIRLCQAVGEWLPAVARAEFPKAVDVDDRLRNNFQPGARQ
jgi:amidase